MDGSEIGGDSFSSDIFVLHGDNDAEVAINMKTELTNRGFKVLINDDAPLGSAKPLVISNAINRSGRCVVLITRDFIRSGYFESGFVWAMDHQNRTRIVSCFPVLCGLQKDDLPLAFRHFKYYYYKDELLYQKLDEKIRNAIPIETQITVTHTGVGLAWSYFYGYLNISLPALDKRVDAQSANFTVPVYPKLVVILPVSCRCPEVMPEEENFRHVGKIDHEVSRAGVHERSYKSTVYDFNFTRSSNNEHVHCHLLIEFATPLLSLHQMNEGNIAQLDKEQMTNERHVFKEVVSQILNYESIMKNCCGKYLLIDYRDEDEQSTTSLTWKKETLSEVVARAVENDMIATECDGKYLFAVESSPATAVAAELNSLSVSE